MRGIHFFMHSTREESLEYRESGLQWDLQCTGAEEVLGSEG